MSWRNFATVGGCETDWTYAVAFWEAGDALLNYALEKGELDLFYFPLFYSYRHALELTLKEIIKVLDDFISDHQKQGLVKDEQLNKLPSTGKGKSSIFLSHSLTNLLDVYTPRMQLALQLACDPSEPLPKAIEDTIRELDLLDPYGQAFRYSKSTKGQKHFPTQRREDLPKWKERLQKAFYHFFGTEAWADNFLSAGP